MSMVCMRMHILARAFAHLHIQAVGSGGIDILHANARARGGTHLELPFVERIRCRSYTLIPHAGEDEDAGTGTAVNLDGELVQIGDGSGGGGGGFQAVCTPRALEVFASTLREEPNDTSAELEPRLVMAIVGAIEGSGRV